MPQTPSPRTVVISASFGAGHDGAATELARRLRLLGHTVDLVDFVDLLPAHLGIVLRAAYRRQITAAPRTFEWLLNVAGSNRGRAANLTTLGDRSTLEAVGADAQLVVSTYPLASQVLGRLRGQ